MNKTLPLRPGKRLVVGVLAAVVVASVAAACGGSDNDEAQPRAQPAAPAAAGDYPKSPAKYLARPFTGAPVPDSWLGRWRNSEEQEGGGSWDTQILAAGSPECRSITRGRTTCWTVGEPGASTQTFDVYAAGAITVEKGMVIFRMTYNPNPNSPQCFEDDAYGYRYTPRRLYFLEDNRMKEHCHRDPENPFSGFTRIT